jgi:acyl-CoA synthetase (NDP forming)
MDNAINALLHPKSIAILGASVDFQKLNGRTLKALLDKKYAGAIYPVNPKYPSIADLKCYADVSDLPDGIDLAIVAVPAKKVPDTLRVLGKKGVRAAVVFSSGFSEIGGEGVALEQSLKEAIRDSGVRVLGPNCLGLINAFENVMATFSQFSLGPTLPGPAAFVSQSGALGTATAGLARRRGLSFGYFVNTGNESDVNFVDMMREIISDDHVRVGAGYIEGLKDGPGLLEVAATALKLSKPLVITKVGRTRAGARAIASHTGSLAGEDAVFDGVIRGAGIMRARSDEHLLDMVEVFSKSSLPEGRGIAFITRSGGAGALMADRAEEVGLDVAALSADTVAQLRKVVPVFGSTGNPVDITAQGLVDPSLMRESLKIVLSDPKVHVAIAWLAFTEKEADVTVQSFLEAQQATTKPFVVSWVGIPEHALLRLREAGIPVLRGAEPAVDAVAALVRYAEARRHWNADAAARKALVLPALQLPANGGPVGSLAARAILEQCGVPVAAAVLAGSADEAVKAAAKIGYPVALKIESSAILHKTEVQGVKLGLKDAEAVRWAYTALTEAAYRHKPDAPVDGVLVQPMVDGDVELVIGLQNDPVFGPVVMVGLGGIHIEVLKDVSFRKAPVTPGEAGRMLDELKSRAILDGVRGKVAINRNTLTQMISDVSCLGAAAGPQLKELDLNPVLAGPQGVTAVDWLMVLN